MEEASQDVKRYTQTLRRRWDLLHAALESGALPSTDESFFIGVINQHSGEDMRLATLKATSETVGLWQRMETYFNEFQQGKGSKEEAMSPVVPVQFPDTAVLAQYVREVWVCEQSAPDTPHTWDVVHLLGEFSGPAVVTDTLVMHCGKVFEHGDLSYHRKCAVKVVNLWNTCHELLSSATATPTPPGITFELVTKTHTSVMRGLLDAADLGHVRTVDVAPANSGILYPRHVLVPDRLPVLLEFIEARRVEIAATHDGNSFGHFKKLLCLGAFFMEAYLWLHPFRNGNGRTARLLFSHLLRQSSAAAVPISLYMPGSESGSRTVQHAHYIKSLEMSRMDPPYAFLRYTMECTVLHMWNMQP